MIEVEIYIMFKWRNMREKWYDMIKRYKLFMSDLPDAKNAFNFL